MIASQPLTGEHYVAERPRRAVDICRRMLSGTFPVLEGCHALAGLFPEANERDPDFATFVMISSEVDALPIGEVRKHWAPDALKRLQPEVDKAVEWAMPLALAACRSIIARLGEVDGQRLSAAGDS